MTIGAVRAKRSRVNRSACWYKLEIGGTVLIAEAKGAASAAASAAVMQHIADLARRIGALEEFARQQGKSESRRRLTDR
jgi:hypothetical protein